MSRKSSIFNRRIKRGDPAFLRLTEADFLLGLVVAQYEKEGHKAQANCVRSIADWVREMRDDMAGDAEAGKRR